MSLESTRTRLLRLRERSRAIARSLTILRARRQALIRALLEDTQPFLEERRRLAELHQQALDHLANAESACGDETLDAIAACTPPVAGLSLQPHNVMGLHYLTGDAPESLPRDDRRRAFHAALHPQALERSVTTFERLAAAMLENISTESRVRRLSREVRRTTRIMRTLEDRLLPRHEQEIRRIQSFLEEREREALFRLRRFRTLRAR